MASSSFLGYWTTRPNHQLHQQKFQMDSSKVMALQKGNFNKLQFFLSYPWMGVSPNRSGIQARKDTTTYIYITVSFSGFHKWISLPQQDFNTNLVEPPHLPCLELVTSQRRDPHRWPGPMAGWKLSPNIPRSTRRGWSIYLQNWW